MYSNEKKINKLFFYWLNIALILVFFIIVVGGLTRLTNSGLSITEWELFKGLLPPLNIDSWEYYFNQYKKIPQYKILYPSMSLEEFKIIFFWEYFHRIIARFIGLFFLIPLVYFHITKKIEKKYIKLSYVIAILILVQGVIGWFMVKSGLINNVTVSHYRLSIHLSFAVIIISSIFWLIMNKKSNTMVKFFKFSRKNIPFLIFILLIFFQIIVGAFVSGLDAGQIYQSWPLMGNSYFPDDLSLKKLNIIFDFDNHSLVQFYHRNLAYLITLYSLFICFYIYMGRMVYLYRPLKILIFFLLLQVILGIFTLISGLNIYLASMHQITSIILVLSALNLYYLRAK
jgi:heme a synthase